MSAAVVDKEDNNASNDSNNNNEANDKVADMPAISKKDDNSNHSKKDSYVIEDAPPAQPNKHDYSQSMSAVPITQDVVNEINNNSNNAGNKSNPNKLVSRFRSGTIEQLDKIKNFINGNGSTTNLDDPNSANGSNTDATNNQTAANGDASSNNSNTKDSNNSKDSNGKSSNKGDNSGGGHGSHSSSKSKHKRSESKVKQNGDSKHGRQSSNAHHSRQDSKTSHSKHSRTKSKSKNKAAEPRRKSMIPMASAQDSGKLRSKSNPPNDDPNGNGGGSSSSSKSKHHGDRSDRSRGHSQAVSGTISNGHSGSSKHSNRHGSSASQSKKKKEKSRKKTYAGHSSKDNSGHGGSSSKDRHGSSRKSTKGGSSSRSGKDSSSSGGSSKDSGNKQIGSGVTTGKDGKKRNILGGTFIWDENTNLEAKIMYRLKNEIFYIFSYYEPVRIVGSGAYAVVLEAIDKRTNKHVAIKKNKHVFEDVRDARRILREIKLLMHFDRHEDIIELIDTVPPGVDEMSSFSDIYLVTPLLESNLEKIINSKQPLTNLHYQYLTYQILRGLKYIHSTGVIHRDIKPENILVNGADCNVKIIDFGLARGVCKDDDDEFKAANTEYVCTRWYRSPEVMCNAGYYDEKMDIWGVGCILAEMVLRRPLFPGNNYMDQLRHIFDIMGTPKETEWIKSDQAKAWVLKLKPHEGRDFKKYFGKAFDKESDMNNCIDLLQKLLEINPNKRISAAEAIDHPYFKGMHDRKAEKTGEKFDLSFEFENKIATKFGVRHMLCESLMKFHKQIRKKERKELQRLKKKLKERKEQKKREKLLAQQQAAAAAGGGSGDAANGDATANGDSGGAGSGSAGSDSKEDNDASNSDTGVASGDDKHKHKHHKHRSKHKSKSKHRSSNKHSSSNKNGNLGDDMNGTSQDISESADLDSDLDENDANNNSSNGKKKKKRRNCIVRHGLTAV